MTQITDKTWAIEVPSMAFGLMVNNYATESELMYMLSMSDIADDESAEETLIAKPLPPGSWRFLFTTKTATEEDARKVVETIHIALTIKFIDKVLGQFKDGKGKEVMCEKCKRMVKEGWACQECSTKV